MKLATVERIKAVINHPNADKLDIVRIMGYDAIVGRDQYQQGDLVVFVQPDAILPADQEWCKDLLAYTKNGRIRSVRLRGEWSMGLVVDFQKLAPHNSWDCELQEGDDLAEALGITKYEPPLPSNTAAKGGLPFDIPRTDEDRWQNIRTLDDLYGEEVQVTLKIDGQSATFFAVPPHHPRNDSGETQVGLTSRSLELKRGADVEGNPYQSNWHRAEEKYGILEKLKDYCERNRVSLAVRGEVYGKGIQDFAKNPHSKLDLDFAVYSVYNIDRGKYEGLEDQHNYIHVASELGLPVVPLLETVTLTNEVVNKYDNQLKVANEQPFEGVVVKLKDGNSFKIINKWYDSEK